MEELGTINEGDSKFKGNSKPAGAGQAGSAPSHRSENSGQNVRAGHAYSQNHKNKNYVPRNNYDKEYGENRQNRRSTYGDTYEQGQKPKVGGYNSQNNGPGARERSQDARRTYPERTQDARRTRFDTHRSTNKFSRSNKNTSGAQKTRSESHRNALNRRPPRKGERNMHSGHSFFRENKDGREQWGEQKVRDYDSSKRREPNRNKWRDTRNRGSQKQRNRESPPPAAGSRDALDNLRAL